MERLRRIVSNWKGAERRLAKLMGGKRIPVTGIDRDGADVVTPVAHVQSKHRKGVPQFLRGWVDGIAGDAAPHGKVGIVVWSTPGRPTSESLVVMRMDQFVELYGPLVPTEG